MTRRFSLAHLTVLDLPPADAIRVAARTGYDTVGLRLLAVTDSTPGYPLMDDKPAMRAAKAAMAETGVGVLDIEFVKITPEFVVSGLEPFVAAGAELGARHVITAPYDPDLDRLADRLGAISDLSSRYGLRAVLEFFPWTVVPDLATALRVVEAAGRAETGILVDMLHFDRSRSSHVLLERIPPGAAAFRASLRRAGTRRLHHGRTPPCRASRAAATRRGADRPAGHSPPPAVRPAAGARGADDRSRARDRHRGGRPAGARGRGSPAAIHRRRHERVGRLTIEGANADVRDHTLHHHRRHHRLAAEEGEQSGGADHDRRAGRNRPRPRSRQGPRLPISTCAMMTARRPPTQGGSRSCSRACAATAPG